MFVLRLYGSFDDQIDIRWHQLIKMDIYLHDFYCNRTLQYKEREKNEKQNGKTKVWFFFLSIFKGKLTNLHPTPTPHPNFCFKKNHFFPFWLKKDKFCWKKSTKPKYHENYFNHWNPKTPNFIWRINNIIYQLLKESNKLEAEWKCQEVTPS